MGEGVSDMEEPRASKRYCVIIQLDKSASLARIAGAMPIILDMMKGWSKGEMENLCRSNDGQLSGFVIKSTKPPEMMRAEFGNSGATINGDTIMIFEIGADFASTGFTRVGTWLQHH